MNIETEVVNKLIDHKYHISCAESCTGGLLTARIVDVPNASRVLNCSFIAYSEGAKTKYVNVKPETIAKFGVVSEEVAAEMAQGAAQETGSEIGVGITGVAGPSGGTQKKPVGTVCFGFFINGKVSVFTHHFAACSRNEVREKSVIFALEILHSSL